MFIRSCNHKNIEELLLNIIYSSVSLGHVRKAFKLAVIKPLN